MVKSLMIATVNRLDLRQVHHAGHGFLNAPDATRDVPADLVRRADCPEVVTMIKMAVRAGVRSMLGDTARAFHIFTDPFVSTHPLLLFVHDLAYNVHRLAGAAADAPSSS